MTHIIDLFRLLSSLFKKEIKSTKPTDNEVVYDTINDLPIPNQYNPSIDIGGFERPKIGEKNKWLYPTEGYGTLTRGKVGYPIKEEVTKTEKKIIYVD